jgi:hypothetical protein
MSRRRPLLFTAVSAGLLLATGCQLRTTLQVDVEEDGSGTVEVAVGLDDDAVARLPDLDGDGRSTTADLGRLVRVDDLEATGWDVTEPATGDADLTWITATKPFGTPEEAGAVLAELTGDDGALTGLRVERDTPFGRTTFGFEGTADLSGGLEAFGDEGLAAALEGEVLGADQAAIEQELGQPLSEVFTLEVSAGLPGSVDGNGTDGDPSAWVTRPGDAPIDMEADSTVYDGGALVLAALAIVCGLAVVALVAKRLIRR